MISKLLDRLFQRSNIPSGTQVKHRLKFILAHDRAAIEPKVFDNMRYEIMRVVSKYVELDEGSLDIRLESDKRMTALIANLPIRMVREELSDLAEIFNQSDVDLQVVDDADQPDALMLEMDLSVEAALDAIAAKDGLKSTSNEDSSVTEGITDTDGVDTDLDKRNAEVSIKLRNAANKAQDLDQVSDDEAREAVTDDAEVNDQIDQLELSLNLPESPEAQEESIATD
ncbi:cell division topological specificity factor MinE [Pseudanabaena sp. FACHB-723]|uniref:Cell division topological specificity factor n=1 Tax=Pseudanabaena mucicola FACHB-723 TaxID=2692860 RepID=A0ABR7ZXG0_9CYAN|nr:cell division topological specificity factor MinE [Pseudanabaena mucicola]MBD2188537.1 cell division topological specificity factor MinE [Pseudanabaena mucicola FACHB-723]